MRWLMVFPARPLPLLLGAGSQATVSLGTSNPLRKWLAAIRPARHVATDLQQHPAGAAHRGKVARRRRGHGQCALAKQKLRGDHRGHKLVADIARVGHDQHRPGQATEHRDQVASLAGLSALAEPPTQRKAEGQVDDRRVPDRRRRALFAEGSQAPAWGAWPPPFRSPKRICRAAFVLDNRPCKILWRPRISPADCRRNSRSSARGCTTTDASPTVAISFVSPFFALA